MVLLEALTLGLPIVATDIAGTRSILDQTPYPLVDPSADGVAEGMHAFLTSPHDSQAFDGADYCHDVMQEFIDRVVQFSLELNATASTEQTL